MGATVGEVHLAHRTGNSISCGTFPGSPEEAGPDAEEGALLQELDWTGWATVHAATSRWACPPCWYWTASWESGATQVCQGGSPETGGPSENE